MKYESTTCIDCRGQGYYVDCMDDLCYGSGGCIHGDGETHCVTCDGEGIVWVEE